MKKVLARFSEYILVVLFVWLVTSTYWAIAEDWNNPSLTSNYSNVLSDLKARDVSTAKMDYSGSTNIPAGVIRWNDTSSRFEKWSGTAWADLWPAVSSHITSTSNPHATTAAQVGAPSLGDFAAHTTNTSNPHSVTAAQIGALRASLNLSDVTNATTARTNIAAAGASDLSSHTGNTSNPHATTAAQVGALKITNYLSELAASAGTARANISAAQSGDNSDLQYLRSIRDIRATGNILITNDVMGGSTTIRPGASASNDWQFRSNGQLYPPSSLRTDYTPWPPGLGGYTSIHSINPAVATTVDCANAINTMYADLIAMGLFQ